jgi:hypothetical protein
MRHPIPNPRRRATAALLLLAALAAGCSTSDTVDPALTTAEGVPTPLAQLTLSLDTSLPITRIDGRGNVLEVKNWRLGDPQTVRGIIFDGTDASGYQVFKRMSNGGIRNVKDFPLQPAERFRDQAWEAYSFADEDTVRAALAQYQGRGIVGGVSGGRSPVTNTAIVPDSTLLEITATVVNPESTFTMSWNTVPGAAGYYFHVYQFRQDSDGIDQIFSGLPAAAYLVKSRTLCLAYLAAQPGATMEYKVGSPATYLMSSRQVFNDQTYYTRISAVDSTGRLIALTRGADLRVSGDELGGTAFAPQPGEQFIAPASAYRVITSRESAPLRATGPLPSGRLWRPDEAEMREAAEALVRR